MNRWVLMFSLVGGAGCSSECELIEGLQARAGNGATHCGHAARGADTTSIDACVTNAFASGKAFFAMYDRQGEDSKVVFGIAGDAQGKVTFLVWDSDPSGGSDVGAVISGDICVEPSVDSSATRDSTAPPLTCSSTNSLGRTCE